MLHLTGTLINVATVLAGTVAGVLLGGRLSDRIRGTVMDGLGLVTILVLVYLFMSLIVDLLYAVLDPRIRYA